jgi:chloramphenicol O-acetyltransferase
MTTTIIAPTDLLLNVSYKVVSYQRLRDSCDWYYLLKIAKVLNESEEFILKINNNNCYVYDKVEKIISGNIEVSRLVISRCMHPLTGEVRLYCGGDAAWIPLPVE